MSNDNLQGMPPLPPAQQNMPPKPPAPTDSQRAPPSAPGQATNYQAGNQSQNNGQQRGSYYQQLHSKQEQSTYYQQPVAPTAEMPERPKYSTPTGPKTLAGAILTEKPQHSIKDFFCEAFVQFINFYDSSTRLTWWVSSILIDVVYAIVFRLFIGSPVILCILTLYLSICWLALCARRMRDAGNSMAYMTWPIIVVLCQNIILYLMFSDDSIYYAETIMYLYIATCVCSLITLCTFGFYKTLIRAGSEPRYIHYI